nr:ATP-binding protein [Sphingomonas xinjiangensis]
MSLLARKADKTLPGALIGSERGLPAKDKVLPATAIYGANASGKTNFILGLAYMQRAVADSQAKWKSGAGTRIDKNTSSEKEYGFFEVLIYLDGVKYRYGFRASSFFFEEEWLYSYPLGREQMLFVRKSQRDDEVVETTLETGPKVSGEKRDHESSLRRTRENSLFLSSAAQDNQPECIAIQRWFSTKLITSIKLNVSSLDETFTSALAYNCPNFKDLLVPLLRAADPCIKDIVVQREGDQSGEDSDQFSRENVQKHKVKFVISGSNGDVEMPFEKQSRGIKRLYTISAGLITALKFGRIYVVDELETSMHPHVASQLLALFQNRSSNPKGAQLIFTTHETRLLNLHHLRRDQVWFCERSNSGESTLFSLLEFSPRKDENFEVGYLGGRYGAVPVAGIDPSWLRAINDDNLTITSETLDG